MKSPTVLLSNLLQGCTRLEPCVRGIDRDLITIEARYEHEGDGFLTIALPSLCSAFDEGLASGKFTCPDGFRKVKGGAIPRLFSGMLCEVFDTITGDILQNPNIGVIKLTREVLLFYKKLQLPQEQESHLDQKAKSKFFSVEATCREPLKFDSRKRFIIERVADYILPNIESFDERELFPKHGPGAVVESITANQKWKSVVDHLGSLVRYGFDSFLWSLTTNGRKIDDAPTSSKAKLISVPKNSTSRRTITVEPCCNQFIQQGFNTLIRNHIPKCGILQRCIDLNDQTKNQHLALEGSLRRNFATIDLSSASDLLTVELVKLVFGKRPLLLEGLLNCRSTTVFDSKRTEEVVKYAGMGNATTFPVQSIVFAVIAIAALIDGTRPTYRNARRAARRVRVYGDDIIVPTRHAHNVVSWITEAGLQVNLKKSFLDGPFKESCGVDAYAGYDVTPMYCRHHPGNISKGNPSGIAHYVQLSNQAWLKGHYELANQLVQIVEEELRTRLPLTTERIGGLGLHSRQGAIEYQKWDPLLHKPQLRVWTLLPVYRKDVIDGYEALLKFFLSPAMPEDELHLQRSPVRFKSRIVQRWVAP